MSAPSLADAVLIAHVLFVLFVVGGFALILAGARLGITCPLTRWEDILRATGREERSFIGRWLAWLLYYDLPEWVFAIAYCAFAAAVIWTWRAIPPRPWRPSTSAE